MNNIYNYKINMELPNLDIISLIEKNSISNISTDYHGKFIEKIKEKFSNEDQKIFVSSFYCYLNHNSKSDFIINLDNVWKWLGFARKDPCKKVLEKHFILDVDYIIKSAPPIAGADLKKSATEVAVAVKQNGGQNKETILMNINTFKKLCLKSNTKKADQVHDYFINLEEALQEIILEESNELKLQLEQKEVQLELKNTQTIKEKEFEKHNLLLTRYAKAGALVYLIKVKSFDDGSFILKIGHSTIGIEPRYVRHRRNYEECTILECFTVDKSLEFESFLHKAMEKNLFENLPGHENEKEIFLIKSKREYIKLINIVSENMNKFNKSDYLEITELQNEIADLQNEIYKLRNDKGLCSPITPSSINKIEKDINKLFELNAETMQKMNNNFLDIQNTLNALVKPTQMAKTAQEYNTIIKPLQGPKVLQINPNTLQIHKIYDTIIDLLNSDMIVNRTSLKRAVQNNSLYKNYRWKFCNRDQAVTEIFIEATNLEKETKCVGYIAKLNSTKTEIVNVYYSMQEASNFNGNIARNSPYYILYDKCDKELVKDFENKKGKPLLYKNGLGQFDANGNLIQDFSSKIDAFRKINISRSLLDSLVTEKRVHNGFTYKYIGKKVKWIN